MLLMYMAGILTPDPNFVKAVIENGGTTVMNCFQCGTCTGSCPSGRLTAFRTRQIVRLAQLGLKDEALASNELWMCTTCYTCQERCPREVKIVDIVIALRNLAVREGHMAEAHKNTAKNLLKLGHSVTLDENVLKMRESLGLPRLPPTTAASSEAMNELDLILKTTKFDRLIGGL
jgi:heterodisulfide reductase subunit C